MYVQVIDDNAGHTLVSASTMEAELKGLKNTVADAEKLGEAVGKKCLRILIPVSLTATAVCTTE